MDDDDDIEYYPPTPVERGVWSKEEHDKFIVAVTQHPDGPWKRIAQLIGTRSVRQVQTHAQKYQEKVNRRQRGLQKNRQKVARLEHRVEEATYDFLQRPRAGKGRKRGKYNKRNSARVAPILPRPRTVTTAVATAAAAAAAVSAPLSSSVPLSTTSPLLSPAAAPSSLKLEPVPPPPSVLPAPVDCGGGKDVVEMMLSVPLPSPKEVHSPAIFKDRPGDHPDTLAIHSDGPFELDAPAFPPHTDSDSPQLSPAHDDALNFTSEAIDSLLYDDIVAVEEAPEHALNVGDVPSLNEALDYFLRFMHVWGPAAGTGADTAPLQSPPSDHR